MPTVRKAEITAVVAKKQGRTSNDARLFEVATSRGDDAFWAQLYEKAREIEKTHGLRVKWISIEER